jgi:hypothetical protein
MTAWVRSGDWRARGPAADGGVRPTIYATARQTGGHA